MASHVLERPAVRDTLTLQAFVSRAYNDRSPAPRGCKRRDLVPVSSFLQIIACMISHPKLDSRISESTLASVCWTTVFADVESCH